MILIVGGTGNLGRALVPLLAARGEPVRVMSRTRGATVPDGCDHVAGDVRDIDAVANAVDGCQTVISAVHGVNGGRGAGPEETDREATIALVDAAVRRGVKRLVLVSVLSAAADHPLGLMRAKFAAEQHLRSTDLAWTIVRPAAYLETWLSIVGSKLAGGGPALVLGRGTNPINFVSARDVAAVIDHCLIDSEAVGRVVEVAGPQNLTLLDLAAALGAAKQTHVPRAAMRMMQYLARPISPRFARQSRMGLYMDTAVMTAEPSPELPRPVRTVQDVIGHPDIGPLHRSDF